jgi:hypothetical protein
LPIDSALSWASGQLALAAGCVSESSTSRCIRSTFARYPSDTRASSSGRLPTRNRASGSIRGRPLDRRADSSRRIISRLHDSTPNGLSRSAQSRSRCRSPRRVARSPPYQPGLISHLRLASPPQHETSRFFAAFPGYRAFDVTVVSIKSCRHDPGATPPGNRACRRFYATRDELVRIIWVYREE